jgi:Domain of unknown function (DUF4157)
MCEFVKKQNENQKRDSIKSVWTRKVTLKPDMDAHPILQLQRTITAQPSGHDLSRIPVQGNVPGRIQAQQAQTSGDIYEKEAESIAQRVMRAPEPPQDDHAQLQTKRVRATDSVGIEVPPIVHDALHSSGQTMNQSTREFMESRFGYDFSQVRVHADEKAAEAAHALHANAFTVGSHIVFGEGQFAPDTSKGRRLLAHELTHSLQQDSSAMGIGATGHIQRDAQTEKEVKGVKSENVTLREKEVSTAETQLAKRMAKRQAEIQQMIDELGPNPKSDKSKDRLNVLKKDLAKDLATIIKEPDSQGVYSGLRKDIIESARYVNSEKLKLKGAQDQWSKYDPIFAGEEVAGALGKKTITAAEFKALVAQESGDLTKTDTKGDIAGIAQLGTKEEKLAGAKSGDRKIPDKALVIAATVISKYADQLDKELSVKPEGVERKKFIMGAYNSGVNAIATAQREAISMGRDGKTWQSLIEGGIKSPLYKAIVTTYPKKTDYAATYKEKSEYPEKIFARLP